MKTIKQAISNLENFITVGVNCDCIKSLNNIDDDKDLGSDPSFRFREKVLKAGYSITKLYAVYFQAWEMDEWACDAIKDGVKYTIFTSHGSLQPVNREEK